MSRTVRVAVVGPAHGVRGEVYVHPDADLGHLLEAGLRGRLHDGSPFEVVAVRAHGDRTLVRLAGVDDRGAAAALRGAGLDVDVDDDPEAGAHWVDDLLGREVVDGAGELVGVVDAVTDGPAHDWLVVARPDGGEVLVPLVDDLVTVGDQLVVEAPPGLLDDDWA